MIKKIIILLLLLTSLNGCFLVPFVNAFKEAGVTANDRKILLLKKYKKFVDARNTHYPQACMSYASKEGYQEIFNFVMKDQENEKLVDFKTAYTEFDEKAYKATMGVKVRYYKIPYYIVNSRVEEQSWEFFVGKGWMITGIKSID